MCCNPKDDTLIVLYITYDNIFECLGDDTKNTNDDFGRKFIGIAADGVLELHGQEKKGWTKLDATISAISDADIIYNEKVAKNSESETSNLQAPSISRREYWNIDRTIVSGTNL